MTTEERALEAAWKACSAWDGKITKPVLRKAIDAAIAETLDSKWMDIETVPKDNTPVWLGHICSYMEPAYFNRTGAGFWVNAYTGLPIAWRPSHWAPMPKPPVSRSLIQKQKEG